MICLYCSRRLKASGRKNPNAKYRLDDAFLSEIDSELKAYALGWIASDGAVRKGVVSIFIHKKDLGLLQRLRDVFSTDLPIRRKRVDLVGFIVSSRRLSSDVCRHLRIAPGKKDAVVRFPELATDDLRWAFIRGYFDGDGSIVSPGTRTAPRCSIASSSSEMLAPIRDFVGLRSTLLPGRLEWNGYAALDYLAKIYDGASIFLQRKRDLYLDWSQWVPGLSGGGSHGTDGLLRWVKVLRNAVAPSKARASDSGFDVTLVEKGATRGKLTLFRTGIKVQPAFGWYFDLVARSSISKTGYILANGIGVIDRTYIGELLVPLLKVDPDMPDLELPARLVQLIPRPIVHGAVVEVEALEETDRGEGGFGSSGSV